MKSSILTAVIAATVLCAQGAYADEAHHPDKKDAPAKDVKASTGKSAGAVSPQMQENMMKMHDLMHKIRDTQDPQERGKLMQEHMQMMQEHMKTMGGMMGGGMMGPGMMGGDGKGGTMGAPAGK